MRIATKKLNLFVLAMMLVYSSLLSACSSLPQESFQQSSTTSSDQSGNHETTSSSDPPHTPQLKEEIDPGEGVEINRTSVDWNNFEINLKQQIDEETAAQDCKSLESRITSADKASDLYSYLIEATKIAVCY